MNRPQQIEDWLDEKDMSPALKAVHNKQLLLEAFKCRAFSYGNFTLASGLTSTYYVNSKKAIFNSDVITLLAKVIYGMTSGLNIEAAGGLEVGAIPMAAALAQCYALNGKSLDGFFVRKEVKQHGSKELVEGVLKPGMRTLILDDVLTTGNSALRAIEAVQSAAAEIVAVVCIVDRLQGAAELLAKKFGVGSPVKFMPIFTIRDFGVNI